MPNFPKTSFEFEHTQALKSQKVGYPNPGQPLAKSLYFKLTIASLFGILLYRLFPYDVMAGDFSAEFISSQFKEDGLAGLKDYLELLISLVIFALFSFGLTGVLRQLRMPLLAVLAYVLAVGLSLSALMEIAQAFLSSRNPNLFDIVSDGIGLIVGWVSYHKWRYKLLQLAAKSPRLWLKVLNKYVSLPSLATVFVSYLVVATLAMVFFLSPNFSNWNSSFLLNLGNEGSGDRPWQGTVSQVQLFDQAASPTDVAQLLNNQPPTKIGTDTRLSRYTFTQKQAAYLDQTGQSPALAWQGEPIELSESGIPLSSEHWLQTSAPVTKLNQRIKSTTELTLDVTIAPANLTQKGPARIVSVSENATERNFTLGQEGKNLVFRLRTPLTGENGSNPQMTVSNVFTDNSSHHIVVTYRNGALQIYIDTPQNLHTFQLPYLGYKLLYYGLIFIPLGSLLGLLLMVMQGSPWVQLSLLFSGLFAPPLLLEGLLVNMTPRNLALENLGLSLVLMIIGLWLIYTSLYRWLKQDFKLNHRKVSA